MHMMKKITAKTLLAYALGLVLFLLGLMLGINANVAQRSTLGSLDTTTMHEVYDILRQDFDGTLDSAQLMDGAKAGLAAGTGDEFTRYMSPQAMKEFTQRMHGDGFVGIGVELGFKNDELVIIAPQPGSPAAKAGVRAGDVIVAIDGKKVYAMPEEEAVALLRGKAGSRVELTVQRGSQLHDISVERRAIATPSVQASVSSDNMGIMTISTFDANTGELARQAAQQFQSRGVRGVVLDMRGNPGGAVNAANDVLSLWLQRGSTTMIEKRGQQVLRTYQTNQRPVLGEVPTVVLLNQYSASASEVVAGALRDFDKAKIVGTQSFGKGSVQEVRPLSNGGALAFTVSRWFTPKGNSIDGVGLVPDTVVEQPSARDDAQLRAALGMLSK